MATSATTQNILPISSVVSVCKSEIAGPTDNLSQNAILYRSLGNNLTVDNATQLIHTFEEPVIETVALVRALREEHAGVELLLWRKYMCMYSKHYVKDC